MSKWTTSMAWIKGVCELFGDQGLDLPELFRQAGIDFVDLNNPDWRCPTEKVSLLWELAVAITNNEAIAINKFRRAQPASFDVLGYAMMSSPTLFDSLECFVRYLRIVSDALEVTLNQDSEGFWVELIFFGGARPVPRQRVEFAFFTFLSFMRWISGRDFSPLRMEFSFSAPENPLLFRDAFNCTQQYDASAMRMLLDPADLAMKLPACNDALSKLHAQFVGSYLKRLDDQQISNQVRNLILKKLPGGEPRRDEIASLLCMGDRTLQRRLKEESTTFQCILDEARRDLAQQHLEQGVFSIGEMAYFLGFADQGTFFRNCKRWFGLSPKQYRLQHAGGSRSSILGGL